MRARAILFGFLGLALASVLLTPLPVTSIGFQDDTSEPCLGTDDPYCEEESGGSTACYSCSINQDASSLLCVEGSHGSKCTIEHEAGNQTCETTGTC